MEELLHKLEVLNKIKKAISQTYNSGDNVSVYHECMELLLDVEDSVLNPVLFDKEFQQITKD